MKTVWLLYILVSFNGNPKFEIYEYDIKQECEQEKVRVVQEIKEVYKIDAEAHCLYTIQSAYK
jgi:hypothetical protein|tara:strand:+ start:249 stop:437 length:189 start_codon:yes stop_codon:yes gene_type:complete